MNVLLSGNHRKNSVVETERFLWQISTELYMDILNPGIPVNFTLRLTYRPFWGPAAWRSWPNSFDPDSIAWNSRTLKESEPFLLKNPASYYSKTTSIHFMSLSHEKKKSRFLEKYIPWFYFYNQTNNVYIHIHAI